MNNTSETSIFQLLCTNSVGLTVKHVRKYIQGTPWMASSRNTTKITQEKGGKIISRASASWSFPSLAEGLETCGGTHWPLQVQEWEEKCREPAPGQGKCKSRAVRRESATLPAGNSPSLCSPARRLFSVEIGHWYPQLKEKRTEDKQVGTGSPVRIWSGSGCWGGSKEQETWYDFLSRGSCGRTQKGLKETSGLPA